MGGTVAGRDEGRVVTVWLVGAGPGDPELLTVAADRVLRSARVVVYDRPSMDPILALAPEARRVCVGRGGLDLPQADVNALLVSLAGEGDVVRLKSGDPFVASRGGEEAVALREAGIGVRVIPGVSAALAAPAAAGIPLMLRQLSVTATLVDGNDDPEHASPPDWRALARLGGTLVILTGRGRIRRTAAALIAGGRPPETPVAVATYVARPGESIATATLATLDVSAVTMHSLVLVAGESGTWAGPWLVGTRGAS
jgi:uroporphyrin-III C-methyltransferase